MLGQSKVLIFLLLVLIKGMRGGHDSKISLYYHQGLGASLQSFDECGGII